VSKTRPAQNWRQSLTIGLSIGVGMAVARSVQDILEASAGQGIAIAAATLAAGIVGGCIALFIAWRAKGRTSAQG
jgi:hypothetical protein